MDLLLSGTVLLVGEGNFSFAVWLWKKAQANLHHERNSQTPGITHICASCLEPRENRFSDQAKANLKFLREQDGVEIILGLDGECLHLEPRIKTLLPDFIIFNFPHVGGKMRMDLNRQLLSNFFQSCSQLCGARVLVSLCRGQGGTPAEVVPRVAAGDTWKPVELAADSGYLLEDVFKFPVEACQEDYTPGGYRGQEGRPFWIQDALVHVFRRASGDATEVLKGINMEPKVSVEARISQMPIGSPVELEMTRLLQKLQDLGVHLIGMEENSEYLPRLDISKLVESTLDPVASGGVTVDYVDESNQWCPCCQVVAISKKNPDGLRTALAAYATVLMKSSGTFIVDICDTIVKRKLSGIYDPRQMWLPFTSMYPETLSHDLSFWEPDVINNFTSLEQLELRLNSALNWDLLAMPPVLVDTYVSKSGRKSRCYRFSYCSFRFPLSIRTSFLVHQQIGHMLETVFGVTMR